MEMGQTEERAKFWRLLTDYEALICHETVAIKHQDFVSLEEAQQLKAALFPVWLQLGTDLGLDRANSTELRTRLEAVSVAEDNNLQALSAHREAAQQRVKDLAVSQKRLRTIGKNYRDDQGVDGPVAGFAACG